MALTLFLVAISKYVGKNVRSRGPIACEETPKGSRPKEINPIKMQPPVTSAFHALQT